MKLKLIPLVLVLSGRIAFGGDEADSILKARSGTLPNNKPADIVNLGPAKPKNRESVVVHDSRLPEKKVDRPLTTEQKQQRLLDLALQDAERAESARHYSRLHSVGGGGGGKR
jgi:hypothetical protein